MRLPELRSCADLRKLVLKVGFLPLFRCEVPGFSVEDLTPDELWFKKDVIGPWEWREEIAEEGEIAYAKLFHGKAGFLSRELYPDFANYRREGYDFDARVDDGLVKNAERQIYGLIAHGTTVSSELRRQFSSKGFETALAALQMRMYVTFRCLEYKKDRYGAPYGWGVARYELCEERFGDLCTAAYDREPSESLRAIEERMKEYLSCEQVRSLLKV